MNAPLRIALITREISQIADDLRSLCIDDDRLFLDMLTGESPIEEVVRALLNEIEREDGKIEALTVQIAERKARRDFAERRKEKIREGLLRVMKAGGLEKLPLPEATISRRSVPAKLVINDHDAVPKACQRAKWLTDMDKVNEKFADAKRLPNWVRREPASETVSIRRK